MARIAVGTDRNGGIGAMRMATTGTQTRSLPSDANISGRNFGPEELKNLAKVLESGTLNCTKGTWVNQFEEEFAEVYGA
jgi:hypothetical protein